jgi:hypothetical protein
MKALSRITIRGAFFIVLLGSAIGQNIQTDFDHQANFSQYKTFSWAAIRAADSLWNTRIKNAIDFQLVAKGWTQVDNAAINTKPSAKSRTRADSASAFPFPPPPPPPFAEEQPETTSTCPASEPCVAVVAIQTTETQRSLQGFYNGFGGWGFSGLRDGNINISERDYQAGTLVIYMFDAKTKRLLWRGSAEGTLSDKADKNEKKLEKVAAKMFKDFPPGPTRH